MLSRAERMRTGSCAHGVNSGYKKLKMRRYCSRRFSPQPSKHVSKRPATLHVRDAHATTAKMAVLPDKLLHKLINHLSHQIIEM